jgi:HEAT repeat protein
VPALVRALDDPRAPVRQAAVVALGQLRAAARSAIADVERVLADTSFPARIPAALSLWQITGKAEPSIAFLSSQLGRIETGLDAATALAEFGPEAARAVPALASTLSSPDYETRIAAADALGRIGAGAESALPALERLREDPELEVREAVRQTIERIRLAVAAGERSG